MFFSASYPTFRFPPPFRYISYFIDVPEQTLTLAPLPHKTESEFEDEADDDEYEEEEYEEDDEDDDEEDDEEGPDDVDVDGTFPLPFHFFALGFRYCVISFSPIRTVILRISLCSVVFSLFLIYPGSFESLRLPWPSPVITPSSWI